MGVEYNEELAGRARGRVEVIILLVSINRHECSLEVCNFQLQENGVQDLVEIVHGDALEADFSQATALFIYLVPQVYREKTNCEGGAWI